jgi:peptidoglycan/xylan/chitin deacetylase (PgdA/CDA1 family)
VRVVLKRGLEITLCRLGLPRIALRLRRGAGLVLAYHNVVPDGAPPRGDRSLHLEQSRLHRQLSLLARTHDVVSLDRVVEPVTGRPRAAITFDDAYRGAVELGTDVLRDLGLPATIFVAPGCLGGQQFWWDSLAGDRHLDPAQREHAIETLQGKGPAILAEAGVAADGDAPRHYATATESEVAAALGYGGLSLGSHSWSHPNLAMLDPAELVEELEGPLTWLRSRFPDRSVSWLSYPYGRRSPEVARMAHRAGYRGGLRIEGGWVDGEGDPFETPRLNVPAGLSTEGLALRSSGLVRR